MSSGIADIVSFFDAQATSNDVSGALSSSAVAFKFSMYFIMFVGSFAMAIYIGRIGIDILAIATRGTKIAETVGKYGTGNGEQASTVGDYVKKNLLDIILIILLITFLMTGYLFRIIAMALGGFGALGNKLFGLDIQGALSGASSESYVANVSAMRPAQQKNEYDQQVGIARTELNKLYELAKKSGADLDSRYHDQFQKTLISYAHALNRAEIAAGNITAEKAKEMKIPESYLKRHKSETGGGVCNSSFIGSKSAETVSESYGNSFSCEGGGTELEFEGSTGGGGGSK